MELWILSWLLMGIGLVLIICFGDSDRRKAFFCEYKWLPKWCCSGQYLCCGSDNYYDNYYSRRDVDLPTSRHYQIYYNQHARRSRRLALRRRAQRVASSSDGNRPAIHQVGSNDGSESEEDRIREFFLLARMEPYTMKVQLSSLSKMNVPTILEAIEVEDVHEGEHEEGETQPDAADVENQVLPDSNDTEAPVGRIPCEGNKVQLQQDSFDAATEDCCSVGVSEADLAFDVQGFVTVPLAGEKNMDTDQMEDEAQDVNRSHPKQTLNGCKQTVRRQVPNECAICLGCFEEDDDITWSSNVACNHVFHEECILDWFRTIGRKHQRGRQHRADVGFNRFALITSFPMLCPCCRQSFVDLSDKDFMAKDELGVSTNATVVSGSTAVVSTTVAPLGNDASSTHNA